MNMSPDTLQATIESMETTEENIKEMTYKDLNGKQRTEVRKNWRACPLSKWNATTVRSYLQCLTQVRFKMDYISDNIRQENAIISQFINQYGRKVLKEFIRDCVKNYKPTKQYPIVTFGFMYSFQRKHILPRILKRHQEEADRLRELEDQKNVQVVDYSDMF